MVRLAVDGEEPARPGAQMAPGWMVLPLQHCHVQRQPQWHGRTEWTLDFGRADDAMLQASGPSHHVEALVLAQLSAQQLQSIEVRAGGRLLFGLDPCEGRRGPLASAGELLLAMAATQGRRGLSLLAADLGACVAPCQLTLRLRVRTDHLPTVEIQVLLRDAARRPAPLTMATAGLPAQR